MPCVPLASIGLPDGSVVKKLTFQLTCAGVVGSSEGAGVAPVGVGVGPLEGVADALGAVPGLAVTAGLGTLNEMRANVRVNSPAFPLVPICSWTFWGGTTTGCVCKPVPVPGTEKNWTSCG